MKLWLVAAFGTACCSMGFAKAAEDLPSPENTEPPGGDVSSGAENDPPDGAPGEPTGGDEGPGGAAPPSTPTQLTLVDAERYVHRAWYEFWDFAWQPEDWTAPVDYSRGATYFRFDISELREPAMLQFCYFQDRHVSEKHACGPQWTFTEPGVFYRRLDNRALWQRQAIDWSRELLDFMLIDNLSEGRARTNVEVSILLVGAGAPLEAPIGWDCPSEWPCGAEAPAEPEAEPDLESIPGTPSSAAPREPDAPGGRPGAVVPERPNSGSAEDSAEEEPPSTSTEPQPLTTARDAHANCAWQPLPSRPTVPWSALLAPVCLVVLAVARRRLRVYGPAASSCGDRA